MEPLAKGIRLQQALGEVDEKFHVTASLII